MLTCFLVDRNQNKPPFGLVKQDSYVANVKIKLADTLTLNAKKQSGANFAHALR